MEPILSQSDPRPRCAALWGTAVLFLLTLCAQAGVAFQQVHNGTGALRLSSCYQANGTDYDQYVWDSFSVATAQAITEVRWRGGYDPAMAYYGGQLANFRVSIYGSIGGNSQPYLGTQYPQSPATLIAYSTGNNAGETSAGTFGGVQLYDYHFVLPSPFQAAAGVVYWVQIEAEEVNGLPHWGLAAASGNGSYFRRIAGMADYVFQLISGDTAFALMTSDAPTFTIAASTSPAAAGTMTGLGVYPSGSTATLTAAANTGFGFFNWTENGAPVSSSKTYKFTVTRDRNLVANFVPAYTVTAISLLRVGGSVTGGGTYNEGTSATVVATAAPGYAFVSWNYGGVPVTSASSYTFTVTADSWLEANFVPLPATALFDFDTGTPAVSPHQGMPSTQSNRGLTASFSTVSGGWSVQNSFIGGVTPKFSGNFLYPSTWGSAFAISFDQALTDIGFDFETGEVSSDYDIAATVRVRAYAGATLVGTGQLQGAWVSGAYPEGHLNYHSAAAFDRVVIDVAPIGTPSGILFVDNIVAQRAGVTTYTMVVNGTPGGYVTGGGPYAADDLVALSAVPDLGYIFVNWTEGGAEVSRDPNYSFAASANRTLVGHFALGFNIDAANTSGIGGTISGMGAYATGTSVTLTAVADAGYRFIGWSENGAVVSTDAAYTFVASADRFIEATFELIIPQVALAPSTPGTLTLGWPSGLPGWVLEESSDLTAGSWVPSTRAITDNGTQCEVQVAAAEGQCFFRLVHP